MKYAHLADVHIGSYRDIEMNNLSTIAFSKSIDECVQKKVDFILISGDLFNTALPDINQLKIVTEKLHLLKQNNISCYVIAGSHDFSPSGKTMLDVLESAGLFTNVVKGEKTPEGKIRLRLTTDQKTGAKITGMLGKKGGLEKHYYDDIDFSNIENEDGYKIFMFHTTITELKPKDMAKAESNPISILPKGFNYYAGGHVHIVKKAEYGRGVITYPGPIFPANFKELEELGCGGYYLIDTDSNSIEYQELKIIDTFNIKIDANNKSPKEVEEEILNIVSNNDLKQKIVLMRIAGKLSNGKTTDIDFRTIFEIIENKNAHFIMKNTSKLSSIEFSKVDSDNTNEKELETEIISKNKGQIPISNFDEEQLIKELMNSCNDEKQEGETNKTYENRVIETLDKVFKL